MCAHRPDLCVPCCLLAAGPRVPPCMWPRTPQQQQHSSGASRCQQCCRSRWRRASSQQQQQGCAEVAAPAAGVGLLVAAGKSHSRRQVGVGGAEAEGGVGRAAAGEGGRAEGGIECWCLVQQLAKLCTLCVDAYSPRLPGHCHIECAGMLSRPEQHALSCVTSWEVCCCKRADPSTELLACCCCLLHQEQVCPAQPECVRGVACMSSRPLLLISEWHKSRPAQQICQTMLQVKHAHDPTRNTSCCTHPRTVNHQNSCGSPQVPLPMMIALSPAKQEKIPSICPSKTNPPSECDVVVRHLVSAATDDTTDTHDPAPTQGCAGAAASCSCSCSCCCQLSQLPYMAACPVVAVLMICNRAVQEDRTVGRAGQGGREVSPTKQVHKEHTTAAFMITMG